MDKIRKLLITRTAIKTLTSESIVDKIISFQFKDVNNATKLHKEVEISGLGKFLMSPRKVDRKIIKLEQAVEFMKLKPNQEEYEFKIKDTLETIEFLKQKQSEFQSDRDMGGVEE